MKAEPDAPDLARLRFTFRGAGAALQSDTSPELVISGPAGTGKSLACLWKLHVACCRTPGVRALILRKTRASVSESALVTFERDVLPPGSGISDGAGRANRRSYRYPNGSEIIIGGIDKASRVMSTEYDIIYVQEAIELVESEWEYLTTRLRSSQLAYQQLLADTNPDAPTHWIKRRAMTGPLRLLESRHEDNPALYDGGQWTARGVAYLAILDALTGPRKDRLRRGLWTQAEGIVYDGYDPKVHLIDPFPVPRDWTRYWAIDFGFTNPFVAQFWAQDPDGRLYLYREVYRTGRLVEDHARHLLALVGAPGGDWSKATEPRPRAVVCDHDAEDRATLTRHLKMGTVAAVKDVSPGIQAVASRLRVAGDGKPRLMLFRDALVERDRSLYDAHKPTCTAEEWESYVWDTGTGRKQGEAPVKRNDHGCLVAGTMVATATGERPIETIRAGDFVLTRDGFRRVLAAGCTDAAARVSTVFFSDGRTLTGTGNHPVFVNATEFVSIDTLRYSDSITDLRENLFWKSYRSRPRTRALFVSDLTASSTDATPAARTEAIRSIIVADMPTRSRATAGCTATFGLSTTGRSPMATKSITGTKTRSTMPPTTWNAWLQKITTRGMSPPANNERRSRTRRHLSTSAPKSPPAPPRGTARRKGLPGTNNTVQKAGSTGSRPSEFASFAGNLFSVGMAARPAIAPDVAALLRACGAAMTMNHAHAPAAADSSRSIATVRNAFVHGHAAPWCRSAAARKSGPANSAISSSPSTHARKSATAACRVLTRIEHGQRCPVYNLTVEGTPEYYANGILVHNCDATRYLTYWLDGPGRIGYAPTETPERTILDDAPPGAWGRELR